MNPRDEYESRLARAREQLVQHERRDRLVGYGKLAVGMAVIGTGVFLLKYPPPYMALVFVPIAMFIVLALWHERVIRERERCARVIVFYERGVARLDNHWQGTGEGGERFLDTAHPYARDLDLFGAGSLFQLLCAARTRAGEQTLATWLLTPAAPQETLARQQAVEELRSRLELREQLAVLGEDVRAGVHPEAIAAWGAREKLLRGRALPRIAVMLALLWLASLICWGVFGWRDFAFIVSAVNLFVSWRWHARVQAAAAAVDEASHDLELLAEVLARLEAERFSSLRLAELQDALRDANGERASHAIRRLSKLVEYLDSRDNWIVKIIDPFIFWTLQCTFLIEGWRARFGASVERWLAITGEMEALSSLAGYAYEHPEDVFAEFTDEAPLFDATGFAHPLLEHDKAVSNDLKLGSPLQVLIISGPNMSGKSTLVRAVGINAVLAQCGAPVRAQRLRMSPLAVAASICVLDSLQGGVSRFYAEIQRLKQIVDLTTGPRPVLFLLDELFSGTNSHDRRIGTESIVRTLANHRAIGIVTTHDLALTQIANAMGESAANVHFEDRMENGRLHFDYRISPGIVQTSNALLLMRSIGLDV